MKIKSITYLLIPVFLFLAGVAGSGYYFGSSTSKAISMTERNIVKNHFAFSAEVCFVNKNCVQIFNKNSSYIQTVTTKQANPYNNHSNLYLCPFIVYSAENLSRTDSWFSTGLRT